MEVVKHKNSKSITYNVTLTFDETTLFVTNPIINLKEHLENELGDRLKKLTIDFNAKKNQIIIEIDNQDSRWIDEDDIRTHIQQSVLTIFT